VPLNLGLSLETDCQNRPEGIAPYADSVARPAQPVLERLIWTLLETLRTFKD